jgi:hypothetical protein
MLVVEFTAHCMRQQHVEQDVVHPPKSSTSTRSNSLRRYGRTNSSSKKRLKGASERRERPTAWRRSFCRSLVWREFSMRTNAPSLASFPVRTSSARVCLSSQLPSSRSAGVACIGVAPMPVEGQTRQNSKGAQRVRFRVDSVQNPRQSTGLKS